MNQYVSIVGSSLITGVVAGVTATAAAAVVFKPVAEAAVEGAQQVLEAPSGMKAFMAVGALTALGTAVAVGGVSAVGKVLADRREESEDERVKQAA